MVVAEHDCVEVAVIAAGSQFAIAFGNENEVARGRGSALPDEAICQEFGYHLVLSLLLGVGQGPFPSTIFDHQTVCLNRHVSRWRLFSV